MNIKVGDKVAIRTSDDEWWIKGINVVFISLNEVEYNPSDRWIQPKGPLCMSNSS